MISNGYRRGLSLPALFVAFCLLLLPAAGVSAQNASLGLSDTANFATQVREFNVGDVVHVRVLAPELDPTDLKLNRVLLAMANSTASGARTFSLENHLDGSYVAAIDSLPAGDWYIRVALADGAGNGFEADGKFSIGPLADLRAIRVDGAITELGANHLVVRDRKIFVNVNTAIFDEAGDPLAFADLSVGDHVVVSFAKVSFSGELVAGRIDRRNNVEEEGVALRGEIEEIGDNFIVVLERTIHVSSVTTILGKYGLPIRFAALKVGDHVVIRGELLDDNTILASLIRVDDRVDHEVEFSGIIQSVGDASIVVLGHRVLVTQDTKIASRNGEVLGFEDLVVGVKVHVLASVDEARNFTALRIIVGDDEGFIVHGKIESLGDQSLTVAGIPFVVTNSTEIVTETGVALRFADLEEGFLVTVFATPTSVNNVLTARRIVVHRPSIEIRHITGFLTRINDEIIEVNNFVIRVLDRTEILDEFGEPIRFADLEVGMRVRVAAVQVVSTALDLRVLVAKSIQVLPDRERRVVGRIREVSETSINIAGVTAAITDRTAIYGRDGEEIGVGDLTVGALAGMHVLKSNTGLIATTIRLLPRVDDAIGVAGVLEAIDDRELVILGQHFIVLPRTVARDIDGVKIPYDQLEVGRPVALRGRLLAGGTLVALHVQELPHDSEDVKVFGPIESIGASTIEVIGIYSFVDGDTKIYDLDRNEVALTDLTIGQTVLVSAEGQADGTLLAQTIQLQDVSVTAGDVTIAEDGSVTVLGVEYVVAPDVLVDFEGEISTSLAALHNGMYVEVSGIRVDEEGYTATMVTVISASTVGVDAPGLGEIAASISMHQNYPNPFSQSTTIAFELSDGNAGARTTLSVFDLTGRRVRTLVDATLEPGSHSAVWDGRDEAGRPVASGVYFYRVRSGNTSTARTLTLVK